MNAAGSTKRRPTVRRFQLDGRRRHKLLTSADVARLPPLRGQEGRGDAAIAHVKLFGGGRFTFYITEFDGDDELYGFTISPLGPDCDEWGYSSLEALAEMASPTGVPLIERDLWFDPASVRECREKHL